MISQAMSQTRILTSPKYNWNLLLKDSEFVGFDTENNGHINLFDEGVVINGFSICVKVEGVYLSEYFPCNHIRGRNYSREDWEPVLRQVLTKKVIAHNVRFDMRSARMLLNEDLDKPFDTFFDTTRMAHLVDENLFDPKQNGPLASPTLDNCCKHFLGMPGKVKSFEFTALMNVLGWAKIAGSEIREYAENDAEMVYRLWEVLAKKLQNETGAENIKYWKTLEMPNYKTLYKMNTLGVKMDIPFCKEWEERCEANMYRIRTDLGFDPAKPTELKPIIYGELGLPVLYNVKKKNGEKIQSATLDSAAMEKYEKMMEHLDNPIARRIIEYRGWSKAVSSYYRPYQEKVDPDGRMRPDYKSHGTLNGRYACANPNLQQIPKDSDNKPWVKDVKSCFIPEVGYELWEFDYSQLELRLGALFGLDQKLLPILNDRERDLFSEMAAEMGWPRQETKTFVYSVDYGAGKGRVSDIFRVSPEEAQRLIDAFYETYTGLGRANARAKYEVETTGRLRYWSGHYRHFNKTAHAYKGFNSEIQGGAADLVKRVMNNISQEMPELRMLLQVHDSLWFEIPTERREEYKRDIRAIMENPFPNEKRVMFYVDGHPVGGKVLQNV